jgi:S1-C subfamily serine protease
MTPQMLSHDLAAIAHRLRQSTVLIQGPAGSMGSGMVWDASGLIVTNAHVVTQRRASVDWLDCWVPGQTLALQVSHGGQWVVCTLTVGRSPWQEQAA